MACFRTPMSRQWGTSSQHPLMPVPAFAGMSGGCRSDLLFKQPSSNSRASSPVLFGEAPGRPVFPFVSPQKMRGMARQGAQPLFFMCPHSLSEIRGAARRATQTSLRSLGSFAASSLLRRAALFVAARETRDGLRQPSSWRAAPIGRQAEPRRRPGACLATARPRAPHPAPPRMTPHESAPRWTDG
jgi:hypothetical protein